MGAFFFFFPSSSSLRNWNLLALDQQSLNHEGAMWLSVGQLIHGHLVDQPRLVFPVPVSCGLNLCFQLHFFSFLSSAEKLMSLTIDRQISLVGSSESVFQHCWAYSGHSRINNTLLPSHHNTKYSKTFTLHLKPFGQMLILTHCLFQTHSAHR